MKLYFWKKKKLFRSSRSPLALDEVDKAVGRRVMATNRSLIDQLRFNSLGQLLAEFNAENKKYHSTKLG